MTTDANDEQKQSRQHETITFRIEHSIAEELRKEAEQKTESLNVLVNQILRIYLKWHKPSHNAGNIDFSKGVLTRIYDAFTDDQIAKIAEEYVKDELKETVYMLGAEYNISSYLDTICTWFEVSGFPYRREKKPNNSNNTNTDIISVRFDMGRKWSIWYEQFIQNTFKSFKVKNLESEVTNNSIMFKIER